MGCKNLFIPEVGAVSTFFQLIAQYLQINLSNTIVTLVCNQEKNPPNHQSAYSKKHTKNVISRVDVVELIRPPKIRN
jgi:hypothetical protein